MLTNEMTGSKASAHSHVRWIIVGLLFWVSMSNFMDRSIFGNLAPEMPQYLHMADRVQAADADQYWQAHSSEILATLHVSKQEYQDRGSVREQCRSYIRAQIANRSWAASYWNINVFFTASYALSMLLMGWLMDVWGLRRGFALAILVWLIAEMMHAVAPEIGNLFGSALAGFYLCRVLLGFGEGGVSPAVIKAIAEWFPKRERALAMGIASGASSVGAVVVPWLLPWLLVFFSTISVGGVILGWRGLYLLTGSVDIGLVIAWLVLYRNPEEHRRVSLVELALIHSDADAEPKVKVRWRELFPHRQTWAFVCAKSLTDGFWWFYLFGSPDFFSRKFGLDPAGRQYLLMLIYLVSALGAIAGGWLSGRLMKLGWPANRARKWTMLFCALLPVPVFCAALTRNRWLAAALITLAASGHQAWGANAHSLPGDMFPKRTVGSLVGIAGVCSTGMSMLLLYSIGRVVKATGSYLPVFFMASVAYLLAWGLMEFLSPNLKPVKFVLSERVLPARRDEATSVS